MRTIMGKNRETLAENIRLLTSKTFPGGQCHKQLAEAMGVPPRIILQWIRGARTPSNTEIYHLAHLFKVSPQELCGLSSCFCKSKNTKNEANAGQIYACDVIILVAQEQKKALLNEEADIEWKKIIASIKDIILCEL